MNRKLLLAPFAAVLLVIMAFTYFPTQDNQTYTILSVTSSVEGEQVFFQGKYFDPDNAENLNEYIERSGTPFRTNVQADEFTALFHKLDGEADLVVKFEHVVDGHSTGFTEARGDVSLLMKKDDWSMSTGM